MKLLIRSGRHVWTGNHHADESLRDLKVGEEFTAPVRLKSKRSDKLVERRLRVEINHRDDGFYAAFA